LNKKFWKFSDSFYFELGHQLEEHERVVLVLDDDLVGEDELFAIRPEIELQQ
jgi:hypothetical protein